MNVSGSKVVIVGAGMVGSATAFCLTVQGVCSEIVMVDLNKEKALGEVLDLQHSLEYLNRNVRISAGDYSDCQDAHVVVITASASMANITSRLELLDKNIGIMDAVVDGIMASGFSGHILVVSNPVDVLSYYVYRRSGLPREQVMGSGTSLETARLKQIIGERMRMDPKAVQAFCMGEHGDSQMVPWSHVRVAGKPIEDVMADNSDRFNDVDLDRIVELTRDAGHDVLRRKGSTQYGIASAATGIISSILRDENRIIPVSVLLEGEYGESGIFAGVPCVLGKEGVIDMGIYKLPEEEMVKFKDSCSVIREHIQKLPL